MQNNEHKSNEVTRSVIGFSSSNNFSNLVPQFGEFVFESTDFGHSHSVNSALRTIQGISTDAGRGGGSHGTNFIFIRNMV